MSIKVWGRRISSNSLVIFLFLFLYATVALIFVFHHFLQCSSDCGQGVHKRTVSCTNPQGVCDPLSEPTQEEPCENHSKCYEWKTGDWSKVGLSLNSMIHLFKFRQLKNIDEYFPYSLSATYSTFTHQEKVNKC